MGEYVTQTECSDRRSEIEQKLLDKEMRLIKIENAIASSQAIAKMILGSVISGFVSLLVVLLTFKLR